MFRTWGRHTADSSLAYCSHAVFATLYFRPAYEVAGQAVGEGGSLDFRPRESLREILLREVAHDLYQAANRGAIRPLGVDLQAAPMHLWLPIPTPQQGRLLEIVRDEAFPGAKVLTWAEEEATTPTRMELAEVALEFHLAELRGRGVCEVLKEDLAAEVEALRDLPERSRGRLWRALGDEGVTVTRRKLILLNQP